jgi:hypothetical protein
MLTSHNLNAAIKNLEEPDQLSGGVNSFDARTTTIVPTLTEQYDPDSSTNWKILANLLEELCGSMDLRSLKPEFDVSTAVNG